jgi:hypothetical protein
MTACAGAARFGVRQLAAAFLPASWLAGIGTESIIARQQAGTSQSAGPPRRTALQSFAQNNCRDEFFRSLFSTALPNAW